MKINQTAGDPKSASFYGSSYINVPLQDAKSTTDIHFKFKTKRPDSFLFLAAGRTDYCMVRLESGKLKVHINLGAGESEVASARGLKLDDLNWHDVLITRRDAEFILIIDNIHITKEKLPGRFFELNIHYGLFLGGQGDFTELFLGHHDSLRGCLSDVEYNQANILKKARERIGAVDVQGVTWTCSPEFEAGMERDISFVEEGAFMSLVNPIARAGARWEFGVKTSSSNGLLLYNTGQSSRSDYVAVEIVDHHLRLIVERGNGAAELISESSISDGFWHSVAVQFNPTLMEITVDGKTSSAQLTPGGNRYLDLDLGETLFIGGMELNKRAKALGQGIKSADISLKGCFRNMSFDGRRIGIPDAKVTLGLLPECVWDYPCTQQPCVTGAVCHQQGVESFRCECDRPLCVKSDYAERYKVFSKTSLPIDLEIVKLVPVVVEEGKNTIVTTENVDVVLDYRKFGIRDSGLLLHMIEPPEHGEIAMDKPKKIFTVLDLAKDKIRYVHDGSENHHDKVMFDLELSPDSGFILPGYLQGKHRFLLHVNVTPVNDAPHLDLNNKVLRLAQGTRKIITKDLVEAQDPDNPTSDLVYSVLYQGGRGEEKGVIERIGKPGVKVDTFTQKEVDDGVIAYAHRGKEGNSNIRQALQVSDGIQTSGVEFLKISVVPLQIRLVNNTGIILTHKSSVKITTHNLTFAANAEDPSLEIRYDIVKLPQFGFVQRLRGPETHDGALNEALWQNVEYFTSQHIAREQIRYHHTSQTPVQDLFKFKVSVMQMKNPTVYDFRVTFTKLVLEPVKLGDVLLNGTKDATITEHELEYITKPLFTPKKDIVFKIIKGPKYGFLNLMTNKRRHLQGGDIFTQEDIESERLRYRLHRKGYSHIRDDFIFQTSAPEAESTPRTLAIIHTPTPKIKNEVQVTLERLQVDEGGRQNLLPTHLDLRASVITSLLYNITHGPQHGRIDVMDKTLQNVLRRNASYFSSEELLSERVYYEHDDSETRKDRFNFVALSNEEEDFQFVGVFHVDIILKNDNTPLRTIDKVFNVVTNGEKILSGRDLKYSDADIDTKPSDIVYTRRGIPNGGLYLTDEPSKAVFEFTQEDLNEGKILFKHEGDEYGKIGLWITDGRYYANGHLEVKASPPYVVISNNTYLVVQHGGVTSISSNQLCAETNLNSWGERIIYEILEGPGHGYLMVLPEAEPLNSFSQLNLEQGRLSYSHDGSDTFKDFFRFRVNAQGATTEGTFHIKIYPASFWEDLIVAHNETIYVEESTSAIISSDNLQVMHPNIAPSDISYFVTKQPAFGTLEIDSASGLEDLKDELKSKTEIFEQSVIDDKRLRYVQEIANETDDYFVVDVTNGISGVKGLMLHIIVIPESVYIDGGELQCLEGDTVQFPANFFPVRSEYYQDKITDFRVLQKPSHGTIRSSRYPDVPLNKFSKQQLEAGLIQYQHDGSETPEDEFTVIGKFGEKESVPAKVKVSVKAINDQKPVIVRNEGLELWAGSSAIITSSHLAVEDEDTPPQNLTYTITSVTAGHIALVSNPNKPIQEFTQALIESNQILFLQTGGQSGGFQFQVSDGETTSEQATFNVFAKLVGIHLVNNHKLHIFPMLKKEITPDVLLAVTSDHTTSRSKSITYVVKTPPKLGKILLEDARGSFNEIERFTQTEVNGSKIWYQHTQRFKNLFANDSFAFEVNAEFTKPLLDQIFNIDISVSSGGLDQFLEVTLLELKEGGSKSIKINTTRLTSFLVTQAGLESPVIQVHLSRKPEHGQVCYRHECNLTIFTQSQFNAGELTYQHDHSDTTKDQVHFSIYLEPGDVLLCNLTYQVNIEPVNDQPFSIVTLTPHLSVVQGQHHVLTRQDLLTEDADTRPEDIVYDVVSGPSQGMITVIRNKTIDNNQKGRFSQHDIDTGKVVYYHSGSMQPTSFYFRVSDGYFNPTYTVFNIHVLPLALNVTSYKPVYLQQCSSVALITEEHFQIETNGEIRNIKYNVTRNPKHGMIYLGDSPSSYFTQIDLENKKVMYMQTDMSAPGDAFQLGGWIIETDTPSLVDMTVTVKPLLIVGFFAPVIGSKNRLGLSALDATPLAKTTNTNPVYEIVRKPRLGRLKKIIRSSGERKNIKEKEISKFSHEELKSGVIYYVIRKSVVPEEFHGMEDSVILELQATIFQPARVEFKFKVLPEGSNVTTTTLGAMPLPPRLPGPKNPVSHEGGISIASPNIKSDYLLISGMVLGVLALAIIVITVVRCRTVKKQERKSSKTDLQGGPLPLPRPPDDLMPSSPRIKRFTSSNGSTPNSIPQCKVIPLGPIDSITSSDLDINARYPYGMSDEPVEDWSSYDTSETGYPHRTANPMLRRNQYWV